MLFLVCSVILATGVWDCGDQKIALSLERSAMIVYRTNKAYPFDPLTSKRSPYTVWPADFPLPQPPVH